MTQAQKLPDGFGDLEPFTEKWLLRGQPERSKAMIEADITELKALYDAMMPRIEAIVAHLNRFPLDAMPEPEAALLDLTLTFAEVAHPVDLSWTTPHLAGVFPLERVVFAGASVAW